MSDQVASNDGYSWKYLDVSQYQALNHEGVVPNDAVISGFEDIQSSYGSTSPLYVARVRVGDFWEVAKLSRSAKFIYECDGEECELQAGEVLCAPKNQKAVWQNSGQGEMVDGVLSLNEDSHLQLIGRAWHDNRWVPGRVSPGFAFITFTFNGVVEASSKYQVLSTEIFWIKREESGLPELPIPIDNTMPSSETNCISVGHANLLPDCHPKMSNFVLTSKTPQEFQWVKAGYGRYVNHAIMVDRRQIGRVLRGDSGESTEHWKAGYVIQECGYILADGYHRDYEVLTACPVAAEEPLPDIVPTLPSPNSPLDLTTNTVALISQASQSGAIAQSNETFIIARLEASETAQQALERMLSNLRT